MKKVFGCLVLAVLAVLAVTLTGCAGNFGITEKFSETNLLIKQANDDRLKGFGAALAACRGEQGCLVGTSMAYAGNIGQQQFFKPETVADYLKAFMPYATLGVDVFRLWRAPGGDSQGMVVTGDGNTFMGIGNKITADNQSYASASFDATIDNSSHSYVQRDSRSSSIGEGTVQDDNSVTNNP